MSAPRRAMPLRHTWEKQAICLKRSIQAPGFGRNCSNPGERPMAIKVRHAKPRPNATKTASAGDGALRQCITERRRHEGRGARCCHGHSEHAREECARHSTLSRQRIARRNSRRQFEHAGEIEADRKDEKRECPATAAGSLQAGIPIRRQFHSRATRMTAAMPKSCRNSVSHLRRMRSLRFAASCRSAPACDATDRAFIARIGSTQGIRLRISSAHKREQHSEGEPDSAAVGACSAKIRLRHRYRARRSLPAPAPIRRLR